MNPAPGRPRVVVVGLGPAGVDLVTPATLEALASVPVRFVRTRRHPAASVVDDAESFDDVYDAASDMDEVYRTIADRVAVAAVEHGEVAYAVPGSPVVAERTVELLRADERLDVELVPALSFLDLAWVRLGVDPMAVSARIVDGHRFDIEAAGSMGALLVAQCDRPEVLEAVKLAVGDALDRAGSGGGADGRDGSAESPQVVLLVGLGTDGERVETLDWHALDRVTPDHLTSVWVPPLGVPISAEVARLAALVATLRRSCPWDRQQTHATLRPHLLEEAHEVLEVLDRLAAVADDAGSSGLLDELYLDLEEELGDLLFQVVFHATLASEAGRFTLADVATGIHDKLVARHPHVFGDVEVASVEELAGVWETVKKAEKGRDSVFDGIPAGLPALALAAKVLKKAATVEGGEAAVAPVHATSPAAPSATDPAATDERAVGEALLAVVDLARRNGIDPEGALRRAVEVRIDAVRRLEGGPGA
jgi:tetrapyrrole methylase family protein / MazG family protein